MLQETTAYQDGTTNNPKFSQKKIIFGKIFGRLMIKMNNVRKKNDKSKCQLEECNNKCLNNPSVLEEDQQQSLASSSTKKSTTSASSSPVTLLPVITTSHPTSVTSFSDNLTELTIDSSSKSTILFPLNNNSDLKHKTSITSDALTITNSVSNSEEMILPYDGQEKLKFSKNKEKSVRKAFSFTKHKYIRNWRNNHSNITLNSSIESSNNEQNDSAYETETETENCYLKKKEKKIKALKNSQEAKMIKKTKLKTLSSKDKEYIQVQRHFHVGLPNKKIHGIVRLQMPTKLIEAHEQYKKQVAQKNNLSESKICHRMFHGTKTAMICKPQHFVNNKCALFCKFGCGVCGIIQEGNRKKYSHYTQRMWFANNAATSLSYCSGGNMKAMFVVDVVSTSPNSILIIEDDEATIPKYLIVFQ